MLSHGFYVSLFEHELVHSLDHMGAAYKCSYCIFYVSYFDL